MNDVRVKDAYPLPRIEDCLDSLAGSHWFSCMDLNSEYWQIPMAGQDKDKTAFTTSYGLYQFTVMPFGLANAPSTMERLMEDVLRGLQWEECLLYMDDIIVPGTTVEQNLDRLERVLQRLREANLKLKPSKCHFLQKNVQFLGHVVEAGGVRTDLEKVSAIQNWPTPKTVRDVTSFVGLCSYYRRYVQGLAAIARPLHTLVEKGVKFCWLDECDVAFRKLKEILCSAPILGYAIPGMQFILDTDASDKATGAVLSQIQDSKETVIAYMSKSLNKHECSYCTTRKELLAVVYALRHFH